MNFHSCKIRILSRRNIVRTYLRSFYCRHDNIVSYPFVVYSSEFDKHDSFRTIYELNNKRIISMYIHTHTHCKHNHRMHSDSVCNKIMCFIHGAIEQAKISKNNILCCKVMVNVLSKISAISNGLNFLFSFHYFDEFYACLALLKSSGFFPS